MQYSRCGCRIPFDPILFGVTFLKMERSDSPLLLLFWLVVKFMAFERAMNQPG